VRMDQHLAAFHCALQAQDERGVAVLWGLYALPASGPRLPMKAIAAAVGIGRATAYRLRERVAIRAYQSRHLIIEAHSQLGMSDQLAD
jgi:hypothetical protein